MKFSYDSQPSLTLASFTAGYAQTLGKAKFDQFFDRLAEKNKTMGSLAVVKDGNVLYGIGYRVSSNCWSSNAPMVITKFPRVAR